VIRKNCGERAVARQYGKATGNMILSYPQEGTGESCEDYQGLLIDYITSQYRVTEELVLVLGSLTEKKPCYSLGRLRLSLILQNYFFFLFC